MKKKFIKLFFILLVSHGYAQMVIGSDQVSEAAILKLDMENRALKIPVMTISGKADFQNPVQSPARGLFFYNDNSIIADNLDSQVSYWGSDNNYHSLSTNKGIDDIIKDSHIPLMVFTTTVGPKDNIPCGSGGCSGWTWTAFSPLLSEISLDSYSAWNTGNNTYTIPETDTYVIEYNTNISNTSNGNGSSAQKIFKNGIGINTTSGRYLTITNRAYTSVMFVSNFVKGDVLDFKYVFTQNNYQLQTGGVNIYKY